MADLSPPDRHDEQQQLAVVQEILLGQERARLAYLSAEIRRLQDLLNENALLRTQLQGELDQLRQQLEAESAGLEARLSQAMGGMMRQAIRESPDDIAEAMGPVMGDAIRVQIRDERETIIEALYPIIGGVVGRALREFAGDLQKNIDARLRSAFGVRNSLRLLQARLRGISPAELALRDALPFEIQQLFLIQRGSGLLLAQYAAEAVDESDSDLIGGMLTAIRDFTRDSFGRDRADQELDEIQYGDRRIIIESGQHVYIAAVITGIEPEGFRTRLRRFVSELHIQHQAALRDYTGDPATLPDVAPMLRQVATARPEAARAAGGAFSRGQRLALAGGGLALVLLLAAACFYVQFTMALLPVAFPGPTASPTVTLTPVPTASPTGTPTATPRPTETPQPTATDTPVPTATNTPVPTATETPQPTATATPLPTETAVPPQALGNVWVRPLPDLSLQPTDSIAAGTPLAILSTQGSWAEVEWTTPAGRSRGWVPLSWVGFAPASP